MPLLLIHTCDLSLVNRDVFANNRLSLVIKTTCNARHFAGGAGFSRIAINAFCDALDDPEYGPSHDPRKTAFLYAMKQKGLPAMSNSFEILAMDVSYQLHPRSAFLHDLLSGVKE